MWRANLPTRSLGPLWNQRCVFYCTQWGPAVFWSEWLQSMPRQREEFCDVDAFKSIKQTSENSRERERARHVWFCLHIFVWGSCFWLCTPVRSSCLVLPPAAAVSHTHNFLTHTTLSHTTYSHITFTYSHTHTTYTTHSQHNLLTHTQLTHTQLSHNFHTQLTHVHNLHTHTQLSHTHNLHITYTQLTHSHTTQHNTTRHSTAQHSTTQHNTTYSHATTYYLLTHSSLAHNLWQAWHLVTSTFTYCCCTLKGRNKKRYIVRIHGFFWLGY